MSGAGFRRPRPHDHEVEHAAHHEPTGMAGQIASGHRGHRHHRRTVRLRRRGHAGQRRPAEERRRDQKTEARTSGTTTGPRAASRTSRAGAGTGAEARKPFYQDEIKALQGREGRDQGRCREARAEAKDEQSAAQMHQHHRWSAGHHRAAGGDRDGGHRAADQEEARIPDVRRQRSASRSARRPFPPLSTNAHRSRPMPRAPAADENRERIAVADLLDALGDGRCTCCSYSHPTAAGAAGPPGCAAAVPWPRRWPGDGCDARRSMARRDHAALVPSALARRAEQEAPRIPESVVGVCLLLSRWCWCCPSRWATCRRWPPAGAGHPTRRPVGAGRARRRGAAPSPAGGRRSGAHFVTGVPGG